MQVDTLSSTQPLLDSLRTAYGIDARIAEFLPGAGESAYSYQVDGDPAGTVHVKRVEPGGLGHALISHGFYLRLLEPLREHVYPLVPRLRRTLDGEVAGRFGDDFLVVTDWIAGATLPFGELRAPVREPLARAIAAVHAGTPRLSLEDAPAETYELPFDARLRDHLDGLGGAPEDVRQLVGPRASEIRRELDRVRAVGERLGARGLPHVLSHSDLHGGNLMQAVGGSGGLWILDWEGARLAPCEEDLAGITQHVPRAEFGAFVRAYVDARGSSVAPEAEAFEFYFRRRCLEDLEDFVEKLMIPGRAPLQRAHERALLRSECLDWLDRMEDDVGVVRRELSAGRA